jgi:hypothetical protein
MNVPVLPILPLLQPTGRAVAPPWSMPDAFEYKRKYVFPNEVAMSNPCHDQQSPVDVATERLVIHQVETQRVLYHVLRPSQSEGCDALLVDPSSFQEALEEVRRNPWSLYTM